MMHCYPLETFIKQATGYDNMCECNKNHREWNTCYMYPIVWNNLGPSLKMKDFDILGQVFGFIAR